MEIERLTPSRAVDRIVDLYLSSSLRSVVLVGPTGVGKASSILESARRIASSLGREFVELSSHKAPRILSDPDRFFVLARISHPSSLEDPQIILSFGILSRASGILALIDINTWLLLSKRIFEISLLERRFGPYELEENVLVAGILVSEEHGGRRDLIDLAGRSGIRMLEISPPSLDEWREWMNERYEEWDERVYRFLSENEHLFLTYPEERGEQFATPRGWSVLARALASLGKTSKANDPRAIEILARGLVGPLAASELARFLERFL